MIKSKRDDLMELIEALSEIVKTNGMDVALTPKIRAYLLDYGVAESSVSLFMALVKTDDFCTIIRNNRSVDDWGSKISALAESTMLQPSFIKLVIEKLLQTALNVTLSDNSKYERIEGSYETDDMYYSGQIVDGKPNGYGTAIYKEKGQNYKNGIRKYTGEFRFIDDSMELSGYGTLYGEGLAFKGELYKGAFKGKVEMDIDMPGLIGFKGSVESLSVDEQGSINKIFKRILADSQGHYDIRIPIQDDLKNGALFEGRFKGGFYDGTLSFKEKELQYCYAEYKNGIQSPIYKLMPDGRKITGEIINGKGNGKCKISYPNGDYYEGTVKDDLRQGDGTYRFSNGTVVHASWNRNGCSRIDKVFIDGTCYKGHINGTIFEGKENKLFGQKKTADLFFQS